MHALLRTVGYGDEYTYINHICLYIKQEYNGFDLTCICIYTHMRTLHNVYFTFYVTSPSVSLCRYGIIKPVYP